MQIAQFPKAVFNLSAICKMKKCLFRSTRWIVPLSICVICANCSICKSCFQFECNLQNEEMSFQIYSLEDRTLINLCNCANFKQLFSISVQSAKEEMIFRFECNAYCKFPKKCAFQMSISVGGSYRYQFV